jgi:hypothetical protein
MRLADYVMQFLADHGLRRVVLMPTGSAIRFEAFSWGFRGIRHSCILDDKSRRIVLQVTG